MNILRAMHEWFLKVAPLPPTRCGWVIVNDKLLNCLVTKSHPTDKYLIKEGFWYCPLLDCCVREKDYDPESRLPGTHFIFDTKREGIEALIKQTNKKIEFLLKGIEDDNEYIKTLRDLLVTLEVMYQIELEHSNDEERTNDVRIRK